jgi:lysozyme family protein
VAWHKDVEAILDAYVRKLQAEDESMVEGGETVPVDHVPDRTTFDRAFDFTLKEEGYYSNDPFDPGGETKYGISKSAYPSVDIKNLTLEKAKSIYYNDYWRPFEKVAEINPALAMVLYDTGVNMGVGTTIRMLQKVTGTVVDGVIGPMTLKAIENRRDDIIPFLLRDRILYYASRPHWERFKNGWVIRVLRLAMEASHV